MTEQQLCHAALESLNNSYAPYSEFYVGAALLTEDNAVFCGCNIENASFSATVCAERAAVFKAISEGKRNFKMMALAAKKDGVIQNAVTPCGVCRQVLAEFCPPEFPILLVTGADCYKRCTLGELFPQSFSGDCL